MKHVVPVTLAIVILGIASMAAATTVMKTDLPTLCERAEKIVLGTVESVEPKVEGTGFISTYVTITPSLFYKGKPDKSLLVRIPGGSAEGHTMKVFGAPKFAAGDRVLVFLESDHGKQGAYRVSGFFQGRYMVFKSKGTSYAVMDSGRGSQIFEGCDEDLHYCLEGKGMEIQSFNDLSRSVKSLIESAKRKKR